VTDFPVTVDFVQSANARQLHDEARGATESWPASFVQTDSGWVYRVERGDVNQASVRAALDAHLPAPNPDPDADLAASINAVDTSKIADAAVKAAVDALKAALVGKGKPAAVSGRPTGR
jgi:hypothetical protein